MNFPGLIGGLTTVQAEKAFGSAIGDWSVWFTY
jgi:hypothetical protein